MKQLLLGTVGILAAAVGAPNVLSAEAPASLTVQVDQPGHAVSPMLWGIFFEDINCSADGGIYAELVRNRSFEGSDKPGHRSLLVFEGVDCCADYFLNGERIGTSDNMLVEHVFDVTGRLLGGPARQPVCQPVAPGEAGWQEAAIL